MAGLGASVNENVNQPECGVRLGGRQRYADLSEGALRAEARALGLSFDENATRVSLEKALEARVALVESLDRQALLDLAVWSGVEDAGHQTNLLLVREALLHPLNRLNEVPIGAMRVLLRLRDIEAPAGASHEELKKRLRRAEGFWPSVRRRRRKLMGSLLSRMLETEAPPSRPSTDPPEEPRPATPQRAKLKRGIQNRGVVSGIATSLRGAADGYIAEKLDEIEERIDQKLEQIDQRMAQWRDREVSNRLRILKITLIFSILVALVSLGYDYLRK